MALHCPIWSQWENMGYPEYRENERRIWNVGKLLMSKGTQNYAT